MNKNSKAKLKIKKGHLVRATKIVCVWKGALTLHVRTLRCEMQEKKGSCGWDCARVRSKGKIWKEFSSTKKGTWTTKRMQKRHEDQEQHGLVRTEQNNLFGGIQAGNLSSINRRPEYFRHALLSRYPSDGEQENSITEKITAEKITHRNRQSSPIIGHLIRFYHHKLKKKRKHRINPPSNEYNFQ